MKSLLLVLAGVYLAASNIYRGHRVVRVVPQHLPHLGFLQGLAAKETGIERSHNKRDRGASYIMEVLIHDKDASEFSLYMEPALDFWTEPQDVGIPVDIQVGPKDLEAMYGEFKERMLPYSVMYEDLQDAIDAHLAENELARSKADFFECYHDYDEVIVYLQMQANRCGSKCDLSMIGKSYLRADIPLFKITNGDQQEKPIMWIDATIHAREWIAPAVALYFINEMVKDNGDNEVQQMLDTYDWYFAPMVNPDGYIFSFTNERMWQNTRKPNLGSRCVGCDANRNFDHNFGGIGTSSNACSSSFHGGYPYSQNCTKVLSDKVMELHGTAGNIKSFITMHSYSQLWMAPWGYTTQRPSNYDELMRVANATINALTAVHGTKYRTGSASEIFYSSSGTSSDWAYGIPEIEYVYTIELRDTGHHGFLLPPDQIIPTGEETWEALKAYWNAIENHD